MEIQIYNAAHTPNNVGNMVIAKINVMISMQYGAVCIPAGAGSGNAPLTARPKRKIK